MQNIYPAFTRPWGSIPRIGVFFLFCFLINKNTFACFKTGCHWAQAASDSQLSSWLTSAGTVGVRHHHWPRFETFNQCFKQFNALTCQPSTASQTDSEMSVAHSEMG